MMAAGGPSDSPATESGRAVRRAQALTSSGESVRRTRRVSAILFLMTAAFIVTRTGRDALYIQGRGVLDLPWTYVGMAAAAGPVAVLVLAAMGRFGPRRVRALLPLLVAALVLVYALFAEPGGGIVNSVFFALVPLVWGVMFSVTWLLAAELLEGCDQRLRARSYAFLGAASISGGLAGGLAGRALTRTFHPTDLLLLGAGLLVVATLLVVHAHRRYPWLSRNQTRRKQRGLMQTYRAEYRDLRHERRSLTLLGIAVLTAAVGVFVEFQFYVAAAGMEGSGASNVGLFSSVYAALNAGALLIQLLLMPPVQRRIGLGGSLLVLPLTLFLGGGAMLVGGSSLLLRSALRLAEGGLKSSIHRSSWEQVYLGFEARRRPAAKLVIDGLGQRTGEAAAATFLLVWVQVAMVGNGVPGVDVTAITWGLVLTAAGWLALAVHFRRRFGSGPGGEPIQGHGSALLPDT